MTLGTGTPETRTEHSPTLAVLNEMIVFAIPAALLIGSIAALGWNAISWLGAIVWGVVGTLAMSGVLAAMRSMELTSIHMPALLGSISRDPDTENPRSVGFMMHLTFGALLGLTGVYTLTLLGWAVTWLSGMIWGAFVSGLALLMLSSIGVVHPRIREQRQADPGPGAVHFGSMTPVAVIVAHLAYGFVFGFLYQVWPLA